MTTPGPVEVPSEGELQADLSAQQAVDAGQDSREASDLAALSARVAALENAPKPTPAPAPAPVPGTAAVGVVALDSFPGADDDTKLGAALAYAAAQTRPPGIQLTNRAYSFTTARRTFNGMRLLGPNQGASNAEKSGAYQPCTVAVGTHGSWLTVAGGDTWDAFIGGGIAFTGTPVTSFLTDDGHSLWHCSHIRDCSWTNFSSVLGTASNPLHMTASLIDGWIEINGSHAGAVQVAGSDCRLFMDGGFFDSPSSYAPAGASQYHLWCDWLDYSTIGPVYITAEAGWGGLRVSGPAYNNGSQASSSNTGSVTVSPGAVIMGRNQNAPCWGALVRVDGGILKMRDALVTFGMSNPSAAGHGDTAAIMVTGGAVLLDGCTYDRCAGQGETVPFVATSSPGPVHVANTLVTARGGAWSGVPRVHNGGGGALVADATVVTA